MEVALATVQAQSFVDCLPIIDTEATNDLPNDGIAQEDVHRV
jgi:hypothetical protein